MQPNTINPTHLDQQNLSSSTRFVRSGGAGGALGFAQVLQVFDPKADSPLTDPPDQSLQAVAQREQESDRPGVGDVQGDSEVDQQEPAPTENDVVDPKQGDTNDQADAQGANSNSDTPVLEGGVIEANAPTDTQDVTAARESAIRLLENQSDQAKLSLKGLVRAKTHATSTDLTTLAVDTQLGREPVNQPQSTPKPSTQERADANQPRGVPGKDADPSVMDKPDRESRAAIEGVRVPIARVDTARTGQIQGVPIDAKADQSGADTGQARSQRADAGIGAAPAGGGDRASGRSGINQTTNRLAGIKATQPTQVVRTIAGTGSEHVGNQDTGSNTRSLVEKMKGAELPSQTRRSGVLAQVQRGLASLLRSGTGEMTLKLTPGNLGEVRIRIKTVGDRLDIRFETTTQEATERLKSGVKELGANLRAKGVGVEHVQIQQVPTPNADTAGASTPFGQSSAQHQEQHTNRDQPRQHRDEALGSEVIEETHTTQPESIWTDLGLDATA